MSWWKSFGKDEQTSYQDTERWKELDNTVIIPELDKIKEQKAKELDDLVKAKMGWRARREIAIEQMKKTLGKNKWRIRLVKNTYYYSDAGEYDSWIVEEQNVYCPLDPDRTGRASYNTASGGNSSSLKQLHYYVVGSSNYTVEEYEQEPVPVLRWERIGPFVYTKSGSSPANFATYKEAETWLQAYLNPRGDEVYFDEKGEIYASE